jgi:hypothetical protein
MAIERPLQTPDDMEDPQPTAPDMTAALEVDIVADPDELESIEINMEDGSIVITPEDGPAEVEHTDDLSAFLEDSELERMASELVQSVEADARSRAEWARAYTSGLEYLGMKIEDRTQPWEGASGVFHPLLSEAVVRFQAQAMGSLMPAAGPARTRIFGKMTTERLQQAQRVETELNYLITEEIPDYRDEMEQMLFKLPLAGSAFKKLYYDPVWDTPMSVFVPAEDFVVAYGASSLRNCPRYTHVMRKTDDEVRKLQAVGFYRDVDLPDAAPETSDVQEKYNDLTGTHRVTEDDPRRVIYEIHADMVMPEPFDDEDGVALPYIITIDKTSREVLSIRRNWKEDDARRRKILHFVHYMYLPGLGFYGTGLIHLIGSLAKSATSILRQLIDAGTLSNLPAGLKARGARITGDATPLQPGEWRDIDVPSGAIRDALFPLPYKEPSGVLYQLLGNVVEEGRRIGSVADLQVGAMQAQAPVGTTLALLERSMKVMTGVQARLHASMKQELRILARLVHDYMDEEYAYEVMDGVSRSEDFDGRVDVVPVSDPNAATMAQRVVQYQAALELARQAPQLYDLGRLHRQMLEVLDIRDAADIVKLQDDIKPKDPVAENMAILKQEPVKAFLYQDHEAHIAAHMAAMQDPKLAQIVGQSPFAAAIQAAATAHITEHVAFQYRKEIEEQLGVALPPEDQPLPEDIEVQLSRAVAAAAAKLFQKSAAEAAQQQAQKEAQNPLTQIQMKELELKETELQHRIQMDVAKLQLDAAAKDGNLEVQRERIAAESQRAGAQMSIKVAADAAAADRADRREGARMGLEIAKELANAQQGGKGRADG